MVRATGSHGRCARCPLPTDLAAYLMSEVPAFENAYLASSSYEMDGPHTTRMAGSAPEWARSLASVILDVGTSGEADRTTATAFAGPVLLRDYRTFSVRNGILFSIQEDFIQAMG